MCRLRSTTNASPRSWRADPGARRPRTPARPPYSWRDGWLADAHTNPTQTPPRSPDAPTRRRVTTARWTASSLMSAGRLESVKIRSSYMHSQGLMVPVDGELTLVRGDDGEPASLLLTADERCACPDRG